MKQTKKEETFMWSGFQEIRVEKSKANNTDSSEKELNYWESGKTDEWRSGHVEISHAWIAPDWLFQKCECLDLYTGFIIKGVWVHMR